MGYLNTLSVLGVRVGGGVDSRSVGVGAGAGVVVAVRVEYSDMSGAY